MMLLGASSIIQSKKGLRFLEIPRTVTMLTMEAMT